MAIATAPEAQALDTAKCRTLEPVGSRKVGDWGVMRNLKERASPPCAALE